MLARCAADAGGRGNDFGIESRGTGEAGGGGGSVDVVADRTRETGGGRGGGLVFARCAWITATVVESGASERGLELGGGAGESFGGRT